MSGLREKWQEGLVIFLSGTTTMLQRDIGGMFPDQDQGRVNESINAEFVYRDQIPSLCPACRAIVTGKPDAAPMPLFEGPDDG